MILVVLENEFNIINSVIDGLMNKVHASTIKRFTAKEPDDDDIQMLKQQPLLGNQWVIILNRKSLRWIKKFELKRDLIIVQFNNNKEYESNKAHIPGEFKIINNLSVKKDVVISWIEKELNVSDKLAKSIYSRANGRLKNIVEGVNALKSLDKVTHADIIACVEPPFTISIYDVFYTLLGIGKTKNYEEIISFLYKFNDSGRWLKQTLLKLLDDYIQVFTDVEKGDLSLKNIESFKSLSNSKLYKELSVTQLYKIIELHNNLSLEYLYLLKYTITGLRNDEVAMGLCSLVKLGG